MSISQFQNKIIDSGIAKIEKPNQPILTVINFVEDCFPVFIEESKKKQIKNESGLTQKLIRILSSNLNDSYPFFFDKEGMEDETSGMSPAVDIDVVAKEIISVKTKVYTKGNRFFALEAKILGHTSKKREKEYVVGHDEKKGGVMKHISCGGMERFKKSIHGNGLSFSCMIGYMLELDFDKWFLQINSWIAELTKTNTDKDIVWADTDKLEKIYSNNQKAKHYSINSRMLNKKQIESIFIFHLWANLN